MARPRKIADDANLQDVNTSELSEDMTGAEEKTIKVYSPVACKVTRDNQEVVAIFVGVNEVPPDVAAHWWAVAHGVKAV